MQKQKINRSVSSNLLLWLSADHHSQVAALQRKVRILTMHLALQKSGVQVALSTTRYLHANTQVSISIYVNLESRNTEKLHISSDASDVFWCTDWLIKRWSSLSDFWYKPLTPFLFLIPFVLAWRWSLCWCNSNSRPIIPRSTPTNLNLPYRSYHSSQDIEDDRSKCGVSLQWSPFWLDFQANTQALKMGRHWDGFWGMSTAFHCLGQLRYTELTVWCELRLLHSQNAENEFWVGLLHSPKKKMIKLSPSKGVQLSMKKIFRSPRIKDKVETHFWRQFSVSM